MPRRTSVWGTLEPVTGRPASAAWKASARMSRSGSSGTASLWRVRSRVVPSPGPAGRLAAAVRARSGGVSRADHHTDDDRRQRIRPGRVPGRCRVWGRRQPPEETNPLTDQHDETTEATAEASTTPAEALAPETAALEAETPEVAIADAEEAPAAAEAAADEAPPQTRRSRGARRRGGCRRRGGSPRRLAEAPRPRRARPPPRRHAAAEAAAAERGTRRGRGTRRRRRHPPER